ncbi:MAG: hypothetical protein AAGD34_11845, partial [Pseudomonadota bacterium]
MTIVGLTPSKRVVLYVKVVPALLLEGSVPDAFVNETGYDETTYSKAADGDARTPTKVYKGGLVMVYGYRFDDQDTVHRLPEPAKMVLPAKVAPDMADDPGEALFPASRYLRWTANVSDVALFVEMEETEVGIALGLS